MRVLVARGHSTAMNELAWQPRFTTYREETTAVVSDLCHEQPNLPRPLADGPQAGR
jgi:hypothetical protein